MLFLSEFAERPQRIRLVLHQQLGSLKLLAVFFLVLRRRLPGTCLTGMQASSPEPCRLTKA